MELSVRCACKLVVQTKKYSSGSYREGVLVYYSPFVNVTVFNFCHRRAFRKYQ